MKTLRDMFYDGPDCVRGKLREHNGEIFEVLVTVDNMIEDYLIGQLLVHPARLLLSTPYSRFCFQIKDVVKVDWEYHTIFVETVQFTWRYKDDKGRIQVYTRDGEGDHREMPIYPV